MLIRHIPKSEFVRTRWRNDGGWTHEIARSHPAKTTPPTTNETAFDESFSWRVSQADIESDGPFSTFNGYQRNLTVLSGLLRLRIESTTGITTVDVRELESIQFDGGARCSSSNREGPVRDLNVIWDPKRVHTTVELSKLGTTMVLSKAESLLVFGVTHATIDATDRKTDLPAGDAAILVELTQSSEVVIVGKCIAIRFGPTR